MVTNIFEYAVRNKLRFPSTKGDLNVEQLWDVPLRSRDVFNLDAIAKGANRAIKEVSEESFVEKEKTPEHARLEMVLAVVKYVIDAKLTEERDAEKRAANRLEKDRLIAALADKQAGKLSEMTEAQLRRRIEKLDEETT